MIGLTAGVALGVLLLASGAPIFVAFLVAGAFFSLGYAGVPIEFVSHQFFMAVNKQLLLAVPFFILAGNLMTWGKSTDALIDAVNAFMGHIRGGLAVTVVAASALFATMCGSGIATAVAIGSIMVPRMVKQGYPRDWAIALVANAGNLGQIIPPSIIMILLADVSGEATGDLFLAGMIPGFVLAFLFALASIYDTRRLKIPVIESSTWKERWRSLSKALPALGMPVVILGGIYGGVFTPTEASAIAVLYALIVGIVPYGGLLGSGNLRRAVVDSLISSCSIYFIIGSAILMGAGLTYMELPQKLTELISGAQLPPLAFYALTGLFFLLAGFVIEGMIIIYVMLPLIIHVIPALGIPMIPFLTFMLLNVLIGTITPPVGVTLYGAASVLKADPIAVFKHCGLFLGAQVLVMVLIMFVPATASWLPQFVASLR